MIDAPDSKLPMPDLALEIGSLRMRNPVMNASGTMGYGHEHAELTAAGTLGAIVTKTVTAEPRAGNPPPRLTETPAGLCNSIGLQNVGAAAFVAEELPRLRALGPPIIVSIGGDTPEGYRRCLEQIDSAAPDAYEINISCPNVAAGGLAFGRSPRSAASLIGELRRETDRPLIAKLTPNVTDLAAIGRACSDAGADALTAVNTFVGLVVDVERECAVLPRVTGGVSGPAIRPLALARVWELAGAVSIPVIGVGGIATTRDAIEFFLVGASAVQIGSALLREPARAVRIRDGIAEWLRETGRERLADCIGALRRTGGGTERCPSETPTERRSCE
jgi:dihydroorotate dehydrogenase (NAD+) catalytic subunit